MAGAGFKDFTAGEILTADDVDTFLMQQTIMVFAGTAARGSVITSPSEGMFTYLKDTDALEYYGGTALGWVPFTSGGGGGAGFQDIFMLMGA